MTTACALLHCPVRVLDQLSFVKGDVIYVPVVDPKKQVLKGVCKGNKNPDVGLLMDGWRWSLSGTHEDVFVSTRSYCHRQGWFLSCCLCGRLAHGGASGRRRAGWCKRLGGERSARLVVCASYLVCVYVCMWVLLLMSDRFTDGCQVSGTGQLQCQNL